MFQSVPREPFWIPLLTIVYFVLADTTSNLTRELLVTNAHQIPPLQQKGLDLQMIVLISKLFFVKLNYCCIFHEFFNLIYLFFRCNDAKNGQLALCDRNANCFFNKDDLTHSCRCKRGTLISKYQSQARKFKKVQAKKLVK